VSKWTYSSEGDNIIEEGPIVCRSQISSVEFPRGAIKPYRPTLANGDEDDNRLIKVLQKVPTVSKGELEGLEEKIERHHKELEDEEFQHGDFGSDQEELQRNEPFSSPPQQQNLELTHMDIGRDLT